MTKYPQAAGAALYTHKAFGIHFVTFLVAFTVDLLGHHQRVDLLDVLGGNLLAGLTRRSATPARLVDGADGKTAQLVVALGFMLLLALINLRGVGET